MAKKSNSSKSLTELKKINEDLLAENTKLKKQLSGKSKTSTKESKGLIRTILVAFLIAVAGSVLVVANVAFWAGNTVKDTDKFVAVTDELIEEPVIQQAIAKYTTESLFNNLDVEQEVTNALPDRASFIAAPLTSQLKGATQETLEKALANDSRFQTLWKNTVKVSHEKFIEIAENYDGNGVITVNDLYQNLSKELEGTKLSVLANRSLPSNVGQFEVAEIPALPIAHNAINNLRTYQILSTIIFVLAIALAVMLSHNRRKVVLGLGTVFAILMAISLISIKILKQSISNNTNPEYRDAINKIAEIVANPLVLQTRMVLLVSVLIIIVAWISGPYKSAKNARGRVQKISEGKIHSSIFSKGENKFTNFVGKNKVVLQWVSVTIIALVMIIVQLSVASVIWYGLLILFLVLLIEILAAPKDKQ